MTAHSGLVQVYTGNGRGKTTAALGLALRARGAGKRVAVVFFDKGGGRYSERRVLSQIGADWFGYGMDRIDPSTKQFRFGVTPGDIAQAEQGIAKAWEILRASPPYDLLVLDEINTVVALGMISERAVEGLIDEKPAVTELVLTGRMEVSKGAAVLPGKFRSDGNERQYRLSYFDRADLVTEMRLIKHYFYEGTPAREGLDY